MTLNQMRYFSEVCRWQNISKAAEKLHVAQPTISIAMQAIEKETGLNLFHREKNKIILTPEANLLLGKITNVLSGMQQLDDEISTLSHMHNRIRLALPLQLSASFLPAILGDFCPRHPDIKLEIVEMGGITALHMVEDGKLDLAFTNFISGSSDTLTYHEFFNCECCFCTWPEHSLSNRTSVAFDEIAPEPLVMLDHHFMIYRMTHEQFNKHKCRPNVVHYTPYLHTVKLLVRQHLCSTLLIRQAVLPGDQIALIPLAEPFFISTGIVMKKGRQIHPDERLLMDYLRKIVQQYPAPGLET